MTIEQPQGASKGVDFPVVGRMKNVQTVRKGPTFTGLMKQRQPST
jgi:hypothetical protein